MKVAALRERAAEEKRVALTPDVAKRYGADGFSVAVEAGAGAQAGFADADYVEAGAQVAEAAVVADGADVLLAVQPPEALPEGLAPGAAVIGLLAPHGAHARLQAWAEAGARAMALELLPRITRAQSMDALSSQANLAGYKAALDGLNRLNRAAPMMMTAAGAVAPARVFVIGAGVAGLQAIATARRLGAVVSATDVRPAAAEEAQSLGATFLAPENAVAAEAADAGGYAKATPEETIKRQRAFMVETLRGMDVVVATALAPGRPAPKLVPKEAVEAMKPGSVIVDLAAPQGGNCELTQPGETTLHQGVVIAAPMNLPSALAWDASRLYARNLYNFVAAFAADGATKFADHEDDEVLQAMTLTRDGGVVHPDFQGAP